MLDFLCCNPDVEPSKDVVGSDVMKVLLLKKYTNMICLLCFFLFKHSLCQLEEERGNAVTESF